MGWVEINRCTPATLVENMYLENIENPAKKNIENAWMDNMLCNVCHLQKFMQKYDNNSCWIRAYLLVYRKARSNHYYLYVYELLDCTMEGTCPRERIKIYHLAAFTA